MVECADGTDGMVVLANGCGVTVPLTVAAAGGLIGRVSDLDLTLP